MYRLRFWLHLYTTCTFIDAEFHLKWVDCPNPHSPIHSTTSIYSFVSTNSRTQPNIIMVLCWELRQVVLMGRVVCKCLAYGTSIHWSQDKSVIMAATDNYWSTEPQSKNTSHIELPAISPIALYLRHLISCFLTLSLIAGHGRGTLPLTALPEKKIWSIIHEKSLILGIAHLSEKLQHRSWEMIKKNPKIFNWVNQTSWPFNFYVW